MTKRRFLRRGTDPLDAEDRVGEVLRTYRDGMAERLEEGLREIQDRSVSLLREIATEVWSEVDTDDDLQERVLAILSRDTALRGLIAHSDERYQALDVRLQSVGGLAEDLRAALSRGVGEANVSKLEAADVTVLEERMALLQKYLASVLEYERSRDEAISEWLQKLFTRGQDALKEEAGRVIGEIGADVDALTESATDRILARMDEQTRSFGYDLASHEARIRLTVTEGREDQTTLLREQLRVLESIESDLTTELDDRLTRVAEITGAATTQALDHVADRIGDRSAEAVTVGMKELLAVIDRRFAWLEATMNERLAALEHSIVDADRTVLPESEPVVTFDRG